MNSKIKKLAIVNVKLTDVPNNPQIKQHYEFTQPQCRLKSNFINPLQNSRNFQHFSTTNMRIQHHVKL